MDSSDLLSSDSIKVLRAATEGNPVAVIQPSASQRQSQTQSEEEKYVVRPQFKDTFKPREVKQIMKAVIKEKLFDKKYNQNETGNWTKDIAVAIKSRLKELELKRYKFMVQVVIGEMKGAGVRMGCRCLWDAQTDKVAEETFINESLFCVAVAFGVYLY